MYFDNDEFPDSKLTEYLEFGAESVEYLALDFPAPTAPEWSTFWIRAENAHAN